MSRNRAKKHHYLSQCYLAGFTDDGTARGKLSVLDMKRLSKFSRKPRGVAYKKDYFTINAPGFRPDALESLLSPIEGQFAEVMRRTSESELLPSGEDLSVLVGAVSFNLFRSPSLRDNIRGKMAPIFKDMLRMTFASKERFETTVENMRRAGTPLDSGADYEGLKAAVDKDGFDFTFDSGVLSSLQLGDLAFFTELLLHRDWRMLVAREDDAEFICSDHPVSLRWKDESIPMPPGLGLKGTVVVMPLTKRLALWGEFESETGTSAVGRRSVATVNLLTILNTDSCVYSARPGFSWVMDTGAIGGPDDLIDYLRRKRSHQDH